jgi:DNA adenine methylase
MKPPLTYYGGKQMLSKLIVSLIPPHKIYCEPFFGGGAVFFSKSPSKLEVINDINGELINFYRVIKTKFKKLEKEVKCTLHSRESHQAANIILGYPQLFDDIKRAWAIWTLANQSYASKLNGGWGYDKKENKSVKQLQSKRISFTNGYAERMEQVQIENRDALKIIDTWDNKDAFFYCDPPYINTNQGHYKGYVEEDFEKLLQVLSKIKGKFLLSSYPSELLTKYAKQNKWVMKKVDMPLCIRSNPNSKGKRKIEVLTANFKI